MKLRYMIEYALRDRNTNPHYEPVGVWVQGPGPGLDIVMEYLPGNEEFQEDADWVINRLVENDIKSLPEDFLEYHRATMSPYLGMRGKIVETEEFATTEECIAVIHDRWSALAGARGQRRTPAPRANVTTVTVGLQLLCKASLLSVAPNDRARMASGTHSACPWNLCRRESGLER